MKSKLCEGCIHYEECWILDPMECGEFKSFEEYIEEKRNEYRDEYFHYINSFEND